MKTMESKTDIKAILVLPGANAPGNIICSIFFPNAL